MLTTHEIANWLTLITYRPGWSFEVYDGRWEGQHFVIRARVADATEPDETTTLDIHSMLPPMDTIDQFERWLAWRLSRIEIHEMREFLRRDGKPIFDPHADGAEHDL